MIALNLYNSLCKGNYVLNFMVQRYSSLVALKHYKGHYVLANKISSIFQFDVNNRLTACLHEFTIINDEFNGEALGPKFFKANGENEERGAEILQKAVEHFLALKVFSPKEIQVARKIAYQPGITQKQVADQLEISVGDLHQYYGRFLKKARDFFHHEFNNTLDAALYLKKEGLL
jgi:DNA-binding CsgD family transcriptional regulator